MTDFIENAPLSTVYGPVQSWRVGKSLGIDLLFINSICSFRCIYCQLGKINEHTMERKIFVSTEKVMDDLKQSLWQEADVITFSGSGEPTLAANLGEVIRAIKAYTGKPIVVLTNSTLLNDPAVREDLAATDQIFCKLDAADDRMLKLIDRPASGLTMQSIVAGIKALRKEFQGHLAIQTMLLPLNADQLEQLSLLVKEIQPDEVQLNTPSRPVPREWFFAARGNHALDLSDRSASLKQMQANEAMAMASRLEQLTGVKITAAKR